MAKTQFQIVLGAVLVIALLYCLDRMDAISDKLWRYKIENTLLRYRSEQLMKDYVATVQGYEYAIKQIKCEHEL